MKSDDLGFIVFIIFGMVIGTILYFIPTIIGYKKQSAMAIFALNLLLGFTGVGWVIALVWSLMPDRDYRYYR